MEQELRSGQDLGRLALLKKKNVWANYEQLLKTSFCGQKKKNQKHCSICTTKLRKMKLFFFLCANRVTSPRDLSIMASLTEMNRWSEKPAFWSALYRSSDMKSDNLQYNTMVCRFAGTNDVWCSKHYRLRPLKTLYFWSLAFLLGILNIA